jgi:putative ABC transport system substrate-binding protein
VDGAVGHLINRNVDLIFTVSTPVTKKAITAAAEKKIPVVFIMYDPIGSGIVYNLSHPGRNITGIQVRGSTPRALQWLLLAVPGIRQIFVPIKFDTPAAMQCLIYLRETAVNFGIKLTVSELNTQEELAKSLASIPVEMDAIFVLRSIFILNNVDKIIDIALAKKLPVAAGIEISEEGILISYGTDRLNVGKQAGRLAKMILQGTPASDIPIEVGEFFLGINLGTAEVLGIKIQNDILFSADNIAY